MTVNQAMVKGQNLKKFRTAKVEIDEIHDSSTSTPPFLKREAWGLDPNELFQKPIPLPPFAKGEKEV
ncbi:hypothetical protein GCM10011340_31680 [Roseivirga thermotolerans]|uniref:Uncharacterized protein n=1 Tax=Roseivirga thermotolerans TaxID=1758176 RepID=A0ABQ3I8B3_9BACT|nr:hypothetical protein GCM10011340_31680 [Roseivirga thermotolerans]